MGIFLNTKKTYYFLEKKKQTKETIGKRPTMEDKMTIYGALVRLFFSLNSNQIYMECFFKKIQKKNL